ncbi:uncharacterized protein LOC122860544 [Aphidius gifuensis]|uniref:uncharacterized protein LOC122860544 n=1 Tax=Aphidius gifuensis TaxID=684658 RepID=UPI001CDC83AF|nr:uncharacterized protein LOC122860544 [Aphidius gifuensis]
MNFLFLIGIIWCCCVDVMSLSHKRNLQNIMPRNVQHINDELGHCASVDFIMGQLGIVNVLAFLDGSWPFSYKQATMLKQLKDRLEKSGFPDALFFVITPMSIDNNKDDNNIEAEAWENVSPDEAMEISSGLLNYKPIEEIIPSDMILIKDNDELNIWKKLKGTRDQIMVIDRCGRLAYQVIVPWSILHLPYVKAAIVSTHNDNPCGVCDSYGKIIEYDPELPIDNDESLVNSNLIEVTSQLPVVVDEDITVTNIPDEKIINNNNDKFVLPELKIIMHAPHYHSGHSGHSGDGDNSKNDYLVLKTGDIDYHGHLDDNENLITKSNIINENIIFDKDEGPGLYGEVVDFWRDEIDADVDQSVTENIEINNSIDSVTNIPEYTVEDEESQSKMIAHYSRLLPWINYILKN